MTTYNTPSDAANTAVRAFLTKLGEHYLKSSFNTGSGVGKRIWEEVKSKAFNGNCAYCGDECGRPTIEHLIMFNRDHCGLHHPGNVVPCCNGCNKRKKVDGKYIDWEAHLAEVVEDREQSIKVFRRRKKRILDHIRAKKYPNLTTDEINAIRAISESIYEGIQKEVERGLSLFTKIDDTLINRRSGS